MKMLIRFIMLSTLSFFIVSCGNGYKVNSDPFKKLVSKLDGDSDSGSYAQSVSYDVFIANGLIIDLVNLDFQFSIDQNSDNVAIYCLDNLALHSYSGNTPKNISHKARLDFINSLYNKYVNANQETMSNFTILVRPDLEEFTYTGIGAYNSFMLLISQAKNLLQSKINTSNQNQTSCNNSNVKEQNKLTSNVSFQRSFTR